MKKESGILDNPVLNYLPSKLEDLAEKAIFNKSKDDTKDWFKGSLSDFQVFGEEGKGLGHQASAFLNYMTPDTRSKVLGSSSDLFSGTDRKSIKNLLSKLPTEDLDRFKDHMASYYDAMDWADPTDRGTMSVSRGAGHALQGGAAVAALLSTPYLLKRLRQHRELKEDKDGIYGQKKQAGIVESLSPNRYEDLLDGDFKTWKSKWWMPALMVALGTGAYSGTKNVIGTATDKLSDADMDRMLEEKRKELTRAMVRDKSESDRPKVKEAAEKENIGRKVNIGRNVALPGLLALWALLTPAFYRWGKKLGNETSENAQFKKFENALDDFERNTPKNTKFIVGDSDDELSEEPGEFLGTRHVTFPVKKEKGDRAKAALNQVFM